MRGRVLTFDHVPTKHRGGTHLVLTCKACNETAGSTIDVASSRIEDMVDFNSGAAPHVSLDVRFHTEDQLIKGRLSIDSDQTRQIRLFGNDASMKAAQRMLQELGPDESLKFTVSMRALDDRAARISILRSAYLATFAVFGYEYAFAPALERVRRQIQEPSVEHIRDFAVRLPKPLPWSERRIFRLEATEGLPSCWIAQIGPWLVFLPATSNDDPALTELQSERPRFAFEAKSSFWPLGPYFGYSRHTKVSDRMSVGG